MGQYQELQSSPLTFRLVHPAAYLASTWMEVTHPEQTPVSLGPAAPTPFPSEEVAAAAFQVLMSQTLEALGCPPLLLPCSRLPRIPLPTFKTYLQCAHCSHFITLWSPLFQGQSNYVSSGLKTLPELSSPLRQNQHLDCGHLGCAASPGRSGTFQPLCTRDYHARCPLSHRLHCHLPQGFACRHLLREAFPDLLFSFFLSFFFF